MSIIEELTEIGVQGSTLEWAKLPHLNEYLFDKWNGKFRELPHA